jgi:hypothetical protein
LAYHPDGDQHRRVKVPMHGRCPPSFESSIGGDPLDPAWMVRTGNLRYR